MATVIKEMDFKYCEECKGVISSDNPVCKCEKENYFNPIKICGHCKQEHKSYVLVCECGKSDFINRAIGLFTEVEGD